MRRRLLLATGLLALAACAEPAADVPAEVRDGPARLKVTNGPGGCFTVERVPPPEGGLAIPRQIVCSPVAVSVDIYD